MQRLPNPEYFCARKYLHKYQWGAESVIFGIGAAIFRCDINSCSNDCPAFFLARKFVPYTVQNRRRAQCRKESSEAYRSQNSLENDDCAIQRLLAEAGFNFPRGKDHKSRSRGYGLDNPKTSQPSAGMIIMPAAFSPDQFSAELTGYA